MEEQQHHPQGPSQLENLDPESDGCYALIPNPGSGEQAEEGTRQHLAWATGDLSPLEGDLELEREVLETAEFFKRASADLDGEELHELTLPGPDNFGTLDFLKFNQKRNKAFYGDGKFGRWSVTLARKNLQIWNYVALIFWNYPSVHTIKTAIYSAKTRTATYAGFYRRSLPRLLTRIRTVIENAQRARTNPTPEDFTPHPVNCGFCYRVNCPVRVELASRLLTAWHGVPIELPTLNLVRLSPEDLGYLKRLTNALKTFVKAVDEEAKRRVFDADEKIPGYEIREKSGHRTLVGVEKINRAIQFVQEIWEAHYPDIPLSLADTVLQNIELSVADVEKAVKRVAPRGQIMKAQELVSTQLSEAKFVTQNPIYYLAQIRD